MGKIRIKTLGDESQEKEEKKKKELERAEKLSREKSVHGEAVQDESASEGKAREEAQEVQTEQKAESKQEKPTSGGKKPKKYAKQAFHSQKYEQFLSQIDRSKVYSLNEALELLQKLQRKNLPRQNASQGGFDATDELPINKPNPPVF